MEGKFLIMIFVGLFLVDSTDGISGGNIVSDDWKCFVAIYNSRHDYICTGTIISMTAAVTSASCLGYYADFKDGAIGEDHRMALFARVHHIDRRFHKGNIHHIKELAKHEEWDPEKPQYDCAVIKPRDEFPDGTQIMSLPKEKGNHFDPGKGVMILGWGASRENFPNEYIMQKGDPYIISMDECKEKYPDENLNDAWFFCTHKLRSGACSGDDGGPVVGSDPKTSKLIIFGIIGYRKGCGYPEYPDIHTHIMSVKDFIKEEVGSIEEL